MNSPGDQEGFLLGKISTTMTDVVDDTHSQHQTKKRTISIDCHRPYTGPLALYNGLGEVKKDAIKILLDDKCKASYIVGFYRFRRNSTLEPFVRETEIYKSLQSLIRKERRDYFLLALMTNKTSKRMSTHTIDYRFFRIVRISAVIQNTYYLNRDLESLPVSIVGLPGTAHSEYRRVSPSEIERRKKLFSDRLNVGIDVNSVSSSVVFVDAVHESMQATLRDVSQQIFSSEEQMVNLEEEIHNLKSRLKHITNESRERPMSDTNEVH